MHHISGTCLAIFREGSAVVCGAAGSAVCGEEAGISGHRRSRAMPKSMRHTLTVVIVIGVGARWVDAAGELGGGISQ